MPLFDEKSHLNAAAVNLYNTAWPVAAVVSTHPEEFFIDTDDEEQEDNKEQEKAVLESLFAELTSDTLAESLELEEQGQQRFWVRRYETNCCFHSSTPTGAVCDRVHMCLFCSAQKENRRDAHFGLLIHLSVANLYVHARQENGSPCLMTRSLT